MQIPNTAEEVLEWATSRIPPVAAIKQTVDVRFLMPATERTPRLVGPSLMRL